MRAKRRCKSTALKTRYYVGFPELFDAVVGGFLGDDHVVDVGFAQAGGGDAHEATLFREFRERAGADIAHARLEAAHELVGEARERALVGDASFYTFRDGLAALRAFLRIAIGRASFHCAGRAHAAIGLERAALIENRFAWRFLGAGEKTADHHSGSTGGDGFGDVPGILDAAIGDHRNIRAP